MAKRVNEEKAKKSELRSKSLQALYRVGAWTNGYRTKSFFDAQIESYGASFQFICGKALTMSSRTTPKDHTKRAHTRCS